MLRGVIFELLWMISTLVLGVLSPLVLVSRRASVAYARLWNRLVLWLARVVCGIEVRIQGREHMPAGAAIYVSKHQSALDTFVLWLILDNPAFILKKELLRIPVFGWFLARTQPIAIDRKAGSKAVEHIARQARARLAAGRNIVIFPEGTRRPVGAEPAYKHGGLAALATLGVPMVPVALNTGLFWPKKGVGKMAGEAVFRFGAPMSDVQDLCASIEAQSNALCELSSGGVGETPARL